jgi:uncharacterized protein YciI
MLFALVALDRPDLVARRTELRPAHLAFLDALGDALALAGPFLNDAGEGVGSIVVIEAETLEAARAVFARDPYAEAGLFDQVTIKPWRLSINKTR